MSRIRKMLLYSLGEKRYLRLLARSFQQLYKTGRLGVDYQDIYFLKQLVRPGDYCIDIGAHLGYFTLELSRIVGGHGHVYAIEPMSKFFNTLRGLVESRRLGNITLYQYAMGGDSGFVEMGIPELNKVKKFAYARAISSHTSLYYVETEQVKNVKGDELFRSLPRVDFIKCDVEGLELSVIRSFLEVIQTWRPVILCELADPSERKRLLDLLSPFSYRLFYLENKKLKALEAESTVRPVSHNHYFIPQDRLQSLASVMSQGVGRER
ncbi:MAG: FkbM family methyltransferase [Bacteroidota bacterium]|nr:FkbM family methyltransferase [Bacteroidota bacterium]